MVVADADGLDFTGVPSQREREKVFLASLTTLNLVIWGKMPSFKMEMSDIDFSSPEGTAEKPDQSSKGGSISGKTDRKKDGFSFNFDFNELEGFGIESNLLKAEKDSQIKNKGQGCSSKNEVKYDTRKNLDIRYSDKIDTGFKKLKESTELAKSDDGAVDTPLSLDKEIVSTKGFQTKGNTDDGQKRQLQLTGLKGLSIKENLEDKALKKQLELTSFKAQNSKSASEAISLQHGDKSALDDSLGKSVKSNSPQLKGSRFFLQSLALECSPRTCIQEAESKVSDAPKVHLEGLNDRARGITLELLGQEKMVVKNAQLLGAPSMSCISSNLQYERNNDADRRVSHPSVFVSTKTSALEKEEPKQLSARASALHLKPFIKQEATKSVLSSSTTSKELRTLSALKRERINEKRESSNGTNETLQSGIALKLSDGKAKKQGFLGLQSDAEKDCNAQVQSQLFTKPQEGSSSSIVQPANPKSNAFSNIKLIKISSFEKHERSGDVDKKCLEEKTSSGVNSSDSRSVITKKMESYTTRSSNMRSEIPCASTFTSNLNGKKMAPWSSPLKRKSLEVSNTEMLVLSPLKRLAGSPVQRKAFEETPIHVEKQNDDQLVLITSREGECFKDLSHEKRSPSKDAPIVEQSMNVKLASLVDDDEYRKKAESCSKELDDLCNTLKKKHEEAKELLVHAVVNNNSLLILNHPLYDEKIRSFARIVNSLLDRKYEIW